MNGKELRTPTVLKDFTEEELDKIIQAKEPTVVYETILAQKDCQQNNGNGRTLFILPNGCVSFDLEMANAVKREWLHDNGF